MTTAADTDCHTPRRDTWINRPTRSQSHFEAWHLYLRLNFRKYFCEAHQSGSQVPKFVELVTLFYSASEPEFHGSGNERYIIAPSVRISNTGIQYATRHWRKPRLAVMAEITADHFPSSPVQRPEELQYQGIPDSQLARSAG